jgi:hypothetical protein
MSNNRVDPQQYIVKDELYYEAVGHEIDLYEAAYSVRMPVMLKGPTGCGKSRIVEYMAWKLGKPLITVACNEDMTASDLIGRFLLDKDGTQWQDGPPLTTTSPNGAPACSETIGRLPGACSWRWSMAMNRASRLSSSAAKPAALDSTLGQSPSRSTSCCPLLASSNSARPDG